ncbi:MAG: Holliday junction resolvase RuvX [Planctomycetes bacterium]|nr:Holliday junction resolvase RuvX [Planctomycetota bacterium]
MKVLAIDYGTKRIGLAISAQISSESSSPPMVYGLELIENKGIAGVIEDIARIVKDREVTEIVIGLPKRMDNSIGRSARTVIEFAKQLETAVNVPVALWDERFTSKEAEVILRDANLTRARKRRQVNITAAQLILQGYLDSKSQTTD